MTGTFCRGQTQITNLADGCGVDNQEEAVMNLSMTFHPASRLSRNPFVRCGSINNRQPAY